MSRGTTEPVLGKAKKKVTAFSDVERFFDRIFSRNALRSRFDDSFMDELFPDIKQSSPKINMVERDSEFVVKAEMPGVEREDLVVTVGNSSVTIRGHVRDEESEETGDFCHHEIRQSHYYRSLALPQEVDVDHVKAQFKNGMVTLALPKMMNENSRNIAFEESE